jgi:hypothetical protein
LKIFEGEGALPSVFSAADGCQSVAYTCLALYR